MELSDQYIFDARTFVRPGFEHSGGEWPDEWVEQIAIIRQNHPELASWGDLAVGCAWGDFSQDVMLVGWCDWLTDRRHEPFLDYCCWRQMRGRWELGLDEETLAQANDWRGGQKTSSER